MEKPVSPRAVLVSVFGAFIGGGLWGIFLASRLAPVSGIAAGLSGTMPPAAMALGLFNWFGVAALSPPWAVLKGIASWRRRGGEPAPKAGDAGVRGKGLFVFYPGVGVLFRTGGAGRRLGFGIWIRVDVRGVFGEWIGLWRPVVAHGVGGAAAVSG